MPCVLCISYSETPWISLVLFHTSYARNLVQWPKRALKKNCSKKPVRTNKKQHLLERFYASRRHKHIWHFNASASTVFLFVVIHSISLAKVFTIVVLNIIPTCKWISLIRNQNEKVKKKNESCSKDRAFLRLSETVSILHLLLPLLGQFISY